MTSRTGIPLVLALALAAVTPARAQGRSSPAGELTVQRDWRLLAIGMPLGVGAVMLAVGVRAKGSSKTTGLIWILPSVDANKTGLLLQGQF